MRGGEDRCYRAVWAAVGSNCAYADVLADLKSVSLAVSVQRAAGCFMNELPLRDGFRLRTRTAQCLYGCTPSTYVCETVCKSTGMSEEPPEWL